MTRAENNKELQLEAAQINRETEQKLENIQMRIQPPCDECNYDGVYRCEACEENFFEGFNIRDYPPDPLE